jgi:hypothetical protein
MCSNYPVIKHYPKIHSMGGVKSLAHECFYQGKGSNLELLFLEKQQKHLWTMNLVWLCSNEKGLTRGGIGLAPFSWSPRTDLNHLPTDFRSEALPRASRLDAPRGGADPVIVSTSPESPALWTGSFTHLRGPDGAAGSLDREGGESKEG